MAIKIRRSRNLKLNARSKQTAELRVFNIRRLEYWIAFDGVYELFYT